MIDVLIDCIIEWLEAEDKVVLHWRNGDMYTLFPYNIVSFDENNIMYVSDEAGLCIKVLDMADIITIDRIVLAYRSEENES